MLLKFKLILGAAALSLPLALSDVPLGRGQGETTPRSDMVEVPAATFDYRLPGEFTRAGRPVDAPVEIARVSRISIMKRQVTAAEYARCVAASACPALPPGAMAWPDRPVVKVSWRDAEAYAAWLSELTGESYRLPTDKEWILAAGSRFRDDPVPNSATTDPSRRWIARYEQEAARESRAELGPQPTGYFGANERGLLDLAGNIWEWTSTCYRRVTLDTGAAIVNCGVRIVEGQHRSYMTDFIRDPRSGGCAVGRPPDNLGFRLVRDDDAWPKLQIWLRRLTS